MNAPRFPHRRVPAAFRVGAAAFTLVEIMMVMAILGIVLGVALPALVGTVRKAPLRQALSDFEEGVLKARMLAILTGQPAELVIRVSDWSLFVRPVAESVAAPGELPEPAVPAAPETPLAAEEAGPPRREELPRFSARLHDSLAFRQLVVNLRDMMDEPEAAIRFLPNGTCDAFTAVLVSDTGEERLLQLEITTGRLRIQDLR
jgi:prepilin-type N-terminal cleavage/methylation domain-containing protein